jgi:hypothetical protein
MSSVIRAHALTDSGIRFDSGVSNGFTTECRVRFAELDGWPTFRFLKGGIPRAYPAWDLWILAGWRSLRHVS